MGSPSERVTLSVDDLADGHVSVDAVINEVYRRGLTQDPISRSWRIWGAIWAAIAGVLALPDVQHAITVAVGAAVPVAYAPLIPGIMAVIWPLVSKAKDSRPSHPALPRRPCA